MASKYQRVGLHVSAAGGVERAPANAKEMGAECFQFFSRSPRGGGASPITDEQAKQFRSLSKKYDLESYIHTPYYINFASKNNKIYYGSINAVREELERGTKLGVKYVMTHMGSARDFITSAKVKSPASAKASAGRQKPKVKMDVPNEALKRAIEGLKLVFKGNPKFTTKLLLEISAGAGAVLGNTFEELAYFLKGLGRKDVHVCLDTCHLFASGYDLRTKEALGKTMKLFRKHLGISQLKLVHVNDSKGTFGGHLDRHEHIGHGNIGAGAFKAMLAHPDFQKVNFIMETDHDKLIYDDLKFLKKHRQQK